ncbi:predicted protein [Naegleria gruberi]|uniref:Predicted protein n=1 Tax=Naegleria gruberi TaxID=5762 RepID=D2VIU9_NAEGR|nr:uncharacterized protein NAEGRDRAFT_49901 [Naegleria gruberi]EFC43415.1 predicted protein [Naegleria gruberi]|eukprot:XP_002676159.1 predicted protein [Naegleria gruberi strain NEG-M]
MEAAYQNVITEQHVDMLLTHQYLFYTKDFKVVSPSLDSKNTVSEKPFYLVFLLHPQNPMLAKIYHSASIKTMKDIGNKTNQNNSPLQSWFQQELAAIDKQKECFDEYFYYLNDKKLVSMLKVHENLYERWSQYSQFKHSAHHFIVYIKELPQDATPLNSPLSSVDLFQAIPASIYAFSIKDAFINGKQMKVGVNGSGWVNTRMRANFDSKYLMMYLAVLIQKRMGARYGYCNIFEDNMKSVGMTRNCGMFVGDQKLTFIGMNVKREGEEKNETNVREIDDVQDYVSTMKDVYGNDGFLIQDLDCVYLHDSFAGCYVNTKENFTFQLWKCKYAEMKETGERIPSFMVNNIVSHSMDESHEGPMPLNRSQYSKLVSDVKNIVFSKLENSKLENNAQVANIIFVTLGDYDFNKFILDSYENSNLSFAKLYYSFQDLKLLDPKQVRKSPLMKITQASSRNYSKLLFTDVRDLTGKPMVWSNSIRDEINFHSSETNSFSGFASKL